MGPVLSGRKRIRLRTRRAALGATLALITASCTGAARAQDAPPPPDASSVTQYVELVPTAGGPTAPGVESNIRSLFCRPRDVPWTKRHGRQPRRSPRSLRLRRTELCRRPHARTRPGRSRLSRTRPSTGHCEPSPPRSQRRARRARLPWWSYLWPSRPPARRSLFAGASDLPDGSSGRTGSEQDDGLGALRLSAPRVCDALEGKRLDVNPDPPAATCSATSDYVLRSSSAERTKFEWPRMGSSLSRMEPEVRVDSGPADCPSCTIRACAPLHRPPRGPARFARCLRGLPGSPSPARERNSAPEAASRLWGSRNSSPRRRLWRPVQERVMAPNRR